MEGTGTMNNDICKIIMIIAFNLTLLSTCISQQDSVVQKPTRLILTDGSELIGTITHEDSLSIVFKTISDISMTIPKHQVKTREILSGQLAAGQYVRPDPNHTRLLLAPTARPLKSGQGYFSAYQIFFPFLAVGIADLITLGGGISLFPFAEYQLLYLAPKITPIQIENLNLAGGLLYITPTGNRRSGLGIYYGEGTYGTANESITLGLGWGYEGSDVADKPVVLVGGEVRASNSFKLITENWFLPKSNVDLLSVGIRFFGERLAADLGFIYPAGSKTSGFPFIPWLGFAYNFGVD